MSSMVLSVPCVLFHSLLKIIPRSSASVRAQLRMTGFAFASFTRKEIDVITC